MRHLGAAPDRSGSIAVVGSPSPAPMRRYEWSRLNPLQIGRYAEYLAKMEFTLFGFDVFGAEVDDKGIDFVVRRGADDFYDVQVKSFRPKKGQGYVFFPKRAFELRLSLLAVLVLFEGTQPAEMFLIPAEAWRSPSLLLRSRDYVGRKSKPEWGINISGKTRPLLEQFRLDKQVEVLRGRRS